MSTTPSPTSSGTPTPDPTRAKPARSAVAELDEAAGRAPLHARDQIPHWALRTQAWFYRWLSNESRILLSLVIVVLAVVAAVVLASSRSVRILLEGLDVLSIIGLFLVNWLGNGGALVPIPGARFIGLLLIFQQAVIVPSWEVFAAAGAAMALGLLSYYIAGVRTAQSYADGDSAGAQDLAEQTGMLDDDAVDFAPGAELDEQAVSSITGIDAPDPDEADETDEPDSRTGWLRRRFTTSLRRAQERAAPVIEQRGMKGMFLLCFAPTPMGTAAAYVGGLMRFGFKRYLVASFAAKYLLAGIVVMLALMFSDAAASVAIPEVEIPVLDITLFGDGAPTLPSSSPLPSPVPVAD